MKISKMIVAIVAAFIGCFLVSSFVFWEMGEYPECPECPPPVANFNLAGAVMAVRELESVYSIYEVKKENYRNARQVVAAAIKFVENFDDFQKLLEASKLISIDHMLLSEYVVSGKAVKANFPQLMSKVRIGFFGGNETKKVIMDAFRGLHPSPSRAEVFEFSATGKLLTRWNGEK